jgi:hypothetical protein
VNRLSDFIMPKGPRKRGDGGALLATLNAVDGKRYGKFQELVIGSGGAAGFAATACPRAHRMTFGERS